MLLAIDCIAGIRKKKAAVREQQPSCSGPGGRGYSVPFRYLSKNFSTSSEALMLFSFLMNP